MDDQVRACMETLANMEPILEMVKGYRKKAIDAGFSEQIADVMAMDFHTMMMRQFK